MTEPADGGAFPELFEVIQDYARRDHNHQVKALRIIAAAYLPLFEVPPMPDAKQVVEDVLSRNGFLLSNPETGQLEPASVDAVVSVATSRLLEEDLEWGGRLPPQRHGRPEGPSAERGLRGLRAGCRGGPLDGLGTILAADVAEDMIEDIVEEG